MTAGAFVWDTIAAIAIASALHKPAHQTLIDHASPKPPGSLEALSQRAQGGKTTRAVLTA